MKKLFAYGLILILLLGCMPFAASASAAESVSLYVTISDNTGKLVLSRAQVAVTDTDGDGVLTVSDALYAAHEAKYPGGAAAGFAVRATQYGLSLTKLWGDTSGSFGYYVDHQSAMSLADPVSAHAHIKAFAYTDTTGWSDKYCFFDADTVTTSAGEAITLRLSAVGFDANWTPVIEPVAGAAITVNGLPTEIKTDADGVATIALTETGDSIISAISDTQRLVPPVCAVSVASSATTSPAESPATGSTAYLSLLAASVSVAGLLGIYRRRHA